MARMAVRLGVGGDFGVVEEGDDGEAGVGGVEEGAVGVVGAPVVFPIAFGGEAGHEVFGAVVGGGFVFFVFGGAEEFGGGHEGAVIVDDVFLAVVAELGVVFFEVSEGVFGGLKVAGVGKFAGDGVGAGDGECGDGDAAAVAEADFVGELGVHFFEVFEGGAVLGGECFDGEAFAFGGDAAVFRGFFATGGGDGAVEGSVGVFDADEVVGAVHGFVEEAAFVLAEVLVVAAREFFVSFEEGPVGHGDLLGVEEGGEGEVGEVFAVVAGGVVPAAVDVGGGGLVVEFQIVVGFVEEAGAALAFEVVDDVGEGVAFEEAVLDEEGEGADGAMIYRGFEGVGAFGVEGGGVGGEEDPVFPLVAGADFFGVAGEDFGVVGVGEDAEGGDVVAGVGEEDGVLGGGGFVAEVVGEDFDVVGAGGGGECDEREE